MENRKRGATATAIVVSWTICCLLAGCGSLAIHDDGRAKLASDGRQAYANAKVTEAPEVEAKNLDYLLSEEIKTVRDNVALQVEFAAVGIANNSGPMFESVRTAQQRLGALGFSTPAQVRDYVSKKALATAKLATALTEASVLIRRGIPVPDCEAVNVAPGDLPEPSEESARGLFDRYINRCKEAKLPLLPSDGLISKAGNDWARAQFEMSQLSAQAAFAQARVKQAADAYESAVGRNNSRPDLAKELTDKEADLLKALQAAQKLKLGGAFEASIDSLVEALAAAASNQANPSDPAQARAAIVLKALPSLAAEAQAFQDARSALPVSGLLLELQRQTVLANAATKQQQLMQQRVSILKARLEALLDESQRWLRFSDAVCSNAVLVAGGQHPGNQCDVFSVTETGCVFGGKPIVGCSLAQSWKTRFRIDKAGAQRELYKAATSYLQAIAGQASELEQQYREIDVHHREALLSKTTALAAWDSLISVPLDQLDAYYKGGLKPAELADLVLKALGVVAITVGVTK